ncbi:MAG: tetratricopeptide repeat protein [Bacteroidota bacterium]
MHCLTKIVFFVAVFVFNSVYAQIDENYLKAIAKKDYNQMDSCLFFLSKAIENNESNSDLFYQRGKVYFQQKQYDNAKKDFEIAENISEGLGSLYLAKIYAVKDNFDQAIYFIEKHLKSKYKESKGSIRLDSSFEKMNNFSKWNDLWLKDWYTEYELAIENIVYLMKNEKYVYAIEEFEKIIEQNPEKDDAYYLRSQIYYLIKDYGSASYDLGKAIKLSSDKYIYYYERGIIYKLQRKNKKALADFTKCIALKPDYLPAYLERGLINNKMQYYKDALNDILIYLKYYELNEDALYTAGSIYNIMEMYQKSISLLNKLIDINPGKVDYFIARIEAYEGAGDYKTIIRDCNNALDLDPKNGWVFYKRGVAKFNLDDKNGACSDWNNAVKNGYFDASEYIHNECK